MLTKVAEYTARTFEVSDKAGLHVVRVDVAMDKGVFQSKITVKDSMGVRILFKDTDPDDILDTAKVLMQAANVIRSERGTMRSRMVQEEDREDDKGL